MLSITVSHLCWFPPHFSTLKYELPQKSILCSSIVFTVFLYSLSVYNLSLLEFFSLYSSYTATLTPLVIPSSSIALKYHQQLMTAKILPSAYTSLLKPIYRSPQELHFGYLTDILNVTYPKTYSWFSPHSTLTAYSHPNFHTLTNGNTLFQFLRTKTLWSHTWLFSFFYTSHPICNRSYQLYLQSRSRILPLFTSSLPPWAISHLAYCQLVILLSPLTFYSPFSTVVKVILTTQVRSCQPYPQNHPLVSHLRVKVKVFIMTHFLHDVAFALSLKSSLTIFPFLHSSRSLATEFILHCPYLF